MTRLLPLAILLGAVASAQTPGSCVPGRAAGTLDVGRVGAVLWNDGTLFGPLSAPDFLPGYTVPRSTGLSPLYSASLWVGGTVGGDLRVSGTTYGQGGRDNDSFEFWPGPLDDGTAALPDPTDCSPYDRIWVVSARNVRDYERGGTPGADLAEWPVGLGAPTVDRGGAPVVPARRDQRIDLAAGERPDLLGQQTAFWVMNDVGNTHRSFGSAPLGVEVRVTAGAFLDPRSPTLSNMTAYRFEVVNRSRVPIESLRVGVFVSGSLGNSADDYLGTDRQRGLAFTYNSDNDDNGPYGYGPKPPAVGLDLLSGAATSVYYPNSTGFGRTPRSAVEADRNMRGLWNDGTPLRERGRGYNEGGTETVWAYSGRPEAGEFWSEVDAHSEPGRQPTPPTVKESLISSPPVTLAPGQAHAVDSALLWARGSDNYRSVAGLREASDSVQGLYDAGRLFPARVRPVASEAEAAPPVLALSVRPNPAAGPLAVAFETAGPGRVRLTVADALGRTVRVLADGPRPAGPARAELDTSGLAAGVYLLVLEADRQRVAQTLTIAR